MKYTRKVTDQITGEVYEISLGEHLTFTETAIKLKIKRSSLIKVLLHMEICQREYDPIANQYRHRLKPEAKEKGLGYRIYGDNGPFDVLSQIALDWISAELKQHLLDTNLDKATRDAMKALNNFGKTRTQELDTEGKVRWLLDYHPDLPVTEIGKGLGISRELVHRYQRHRNKQLWWSQKKRHAPLEKTLSGLTQDHFAETLEAFAA
ncbi:hypothetical protein [Thalassospira lohafexi]|uniref:Uncharacterized protein n=1 Tax=Thalassospira lohafexi TaxID=744227 RepID=A0A2N3LB34_9PROT|nr:hypothetical protein [Thalassospira lohafexi]PKR59930.1 hypothetical protein COO92_00715 [Thalassospira lohafexi]